MEAFRIDKIIDCHSLLLGFAMEVFKKFAREGAFAFFANAHHDFFTFCGNQILLLK